jgi:hypothetical protein
MYIIDSGNNCLKFIPIVGGSYFGKTMSSLTPYIICGTNSVLATTTTALNNPSNVVLDTNDNIYISDSGNNQIIFNYVFLFTH